MTTEGAQPFDDDGNITEFHSKSRGHVPKALSIKLLKELLCRRQTARGQLAGSLVHAISMLLETVFINQSPAAGGFDSAKESDARWAATKRS